MKFLIDESPLVVQPTLAKMLGLNRAIVLQQLHYWLSNPKAGVWHEGYKWIHNTYEEWQANFPFWSVDTVKRTLLSLEDDGIVVSKQFAPSAYDKTKSYRIAEEVLAPILDAICTKDDGNLHQSIQRLHTETTTDILASNENSFSADLPLEWQIVSGNKTITLDPAKQKDNEYRDRANLMAMGFGINSDHAFAIAYTFMKTRGILIPENKVKAQRKAIKEMIEMKVNAAHVEKAVKDLLKKNMTVTDLFSVSKTAIALANPAPDNKPQKYEKASEGEYIE